MRFYLKEPKAKEDKPPFSDVSQQLKSKIEDIIGAPIIDSEIAWGGYSPAFSALIKTDQGSDFFVKGSYPDHTAHGYKILEQEINVYKNIPDLADITPKFIDSVHEDDEDDWHIGIWEAVPNGQIKRALSDEDISRIFKTLSDFRKGFDLKNAANHVSPSQKAPFVKDVMSGKNSWIKFTQHVPRQDDFISQFSVPNDAKNWLDRHLDRLIDLSQIKVKEGHMGLVHFDLSLDNILHDQDGRVFIIDWPDASIGNTAFDTIYLCINMMIESGQPAWECYAKWCGIYGTEYSAATVSAVLAKYAGYHALNSYRPIPEKLPRLRWKQKSILWACLLWLSRLGLCEEPPLFAGENEES